MERPASSAIGVMSFVTAIALVFNVATTNADFTFGTPANLGPTVNSSYVEAQLSISADGLMLYFASDRPGGYGDSDIWVTKRPTIVDDWGTPENLGPPVNTSQCEYCPCISADGLELYFGLYNPEGNYIYDIWMAKRPTINDAWGMPIKLGPPVNTSGVEDATHLSTDGLELYFTAYNRAGGYGTDDIWITRRATKDDPWELPTNLGAVVNTPASEDHPFLSADGLALFFSEDRGQPLHPLRPGGFGDVDMWVTTRSSISEPWGTPVNLGPTVNSASLDGGPVISPDGFTLYFSSERPGGFGGVWGDIYQAPIIPIVDFNGDGTVDGTEVLALAHRWGTDDSLCDIGPMPWGDGIVDVQDLMVLAEHVGEAVDDPTLVAHWALDESEGMTACDNAGTNDGTVTGLAVWQPGTGKVDGALEFDGTTFVAAGYVLSPSDGPFSVLAWVQGGAPGQTIISQQDGANWLIADASGALMTELKSAGRQASVLYSDSVITDGDWHHVGFTWDGSNRSLYVDDILVAEDTDIGLVDCYGGLNIGCGKNMTPGTFFTGLIDDVRIYNRAVKP